MNFEEFLAKYQKEEVHEYNQTQMPKPVASVCVQTYQHEGYIGKCLDNILNQETDFSFEILVGEDNSKDKTREICQDYADKYPDKIRLFLHHRENNIRIQNKPSGRFNFLYNLYASKGKYVAFCEGDDHWTDKKKLQKQFDLLESRNEYTASFHDVQVRRDGQLTESHILTFNPLFDITKTDITLTDFIGTKWLIPLCSLFFKREEFQIGEYLCSSPNGDFPLFLSLLLKGNMYKLPESMAVYVSDNNQSVTNNRNVVDRIQFELDKLRTINLLLAENGSINNSHVFTALANRVQHIEKLAKVLDNSKIIRQYLKLNKWLKNLAK